MQHCNQTRLCISGLGFSVSSLLANVIVDTKKEVDLYSAFSLYCSTSHSRRSGTDHTVLPANYLVSINQMAHPQTEVADI